VSYDTVEMACRKAQYIKQHGLGGAMWWELSGDKAGEESIVTNVSVLFLFYVSPSPLDFCLAARVNASAHWCVFHTRNKSPR
jgi:hypothetical protein